MKMLKDYTSAEKIKAFNKIYAVCETRFKEDCNPDSDFDGEDSFHDVAEIALGLTDEDWENAYVAEDVV